MPETASIRAPILAGGISKQPAEVRSPGQVEDALNADFVLAFGMLNRAGTVHSVALGGTLTAQSWLAVKTLEGGDTPIVIVQSDGSVRVIDGGTEANVHASDAVTAYLANTHAKRPMCPSVDGNEGVLRISNPAVIPVAIASPSIGAAGDRDTYDALESFTPPTPGRAWRAKTGGRGRPAGLYRYLPGRGTFATARFNTYNASDSTTGNTVELFCGRAQNPRGFRLFSSRYLVNTTTAVYATASSPAGTVGTVAGLSLAGYTFQAGDQLHYGGTVGGGTAGAYNITGYSGGIVFLEGTIPGIAPGNMDVRGIGRMVEVTENFALEPVATMDDAAVRYTDALRAAGLVNACVHWEWVSFTNYTGRFTITCSDGGPKAGFNASYCIQAPTAAASVADTAFTSPTVTAGTGPWEDFTTSPKERWTPVAAPDQDDAILDPEKMPVRVRKVDTSSYAETTLDLGAWHYWRLGDSTDNNTAADHAGHSLGTYTNSPTRGVTGLVTGDTDTATTFDGTNDYVAITTWQAIGDCEAITVEMILSHTNAVIGERCAFHMRQTNDLYVTVNKTAVNRITVYAGGGEYRCDVTGLNAGTKKHVVVVATATSVRVEVNGVAQTVTTVTPATGNPGIAAVDIPYTINIGRRIDASMYFEGTIDEVAVYPFGFSAATATSTSLAAWRYAQSNGTTTSLWAVEQGEYAPRTTGNSETNPVPSFVKNGKGIEAMAVWQSRETWGAGRAVTMARTDEGTSFFVKDTEVITDADPIDRVISQEGDIVHLRPFGSICVAITNGPAHYELSARGGGLTPASLNSRAGLRRAITDAAPAMVDQRLYLLAPSLGSGVDAGFGTLLEGQIDEQAVAAVYDDVGQHVKGLVDPADLDDLVLLPVGTDGKIILAEIGGTRLFVYQTAFIGPEQRQRAWSVWDIGGTIQCADADDETVYLIVLRSGKYLIETWRPDPPADWPTGSHRLDGRLSIIGGAFGSGVTTFTMPTNVPATGIDTVVKADGTTYTATPINGTQFTVAANLSGVTVTAGRSFECTARLSRPFVRDLNGQAYIGQTVTLSHTIITASDLAAASAVVTNDSRAPRAFPFRELWHEPGRGNAWTRGPAGRTTVDLEITGPKPNYIGTVEQVVDSTTRRT